MPTSIYEAYFPVLAQALLASGLAAALIAMGVLLGKRVRNRVKDTPYECGIPPTGGARDRFSVKFYLVAMLFTLSFSSSRRARAAQSIFAWPSLSQ